MSLKPKPTPSQIRKAGGISPARQKYHYLGKKLTRLVELDFQLNKALVLESNPKVVSELRAAITANHQTRKHIRKAMDLIK